MKRARFIPEARREFLAEVSYYNKAQPDLGARFTGAVEEAAARALAFPLAGTPSVAGTRRVILADADERTCPANCGCPLSHLDPLRSGHMIPFSSAAHSEGKENFNLKRA